MDHLFWIGPVIAVVVVATTVVPLLFRVLKTRSGSIAPKLATLLGGQVAPTGERDGEVQVTGGWRGHNVRVKLWAVAGSGTATFEMMLPKGAVPSFGGFDLQYDEDDAAKAARSATGDVWAAKDAGSEVLASPHAAPHVVLNSSSDAKNFQQLPQQLQMQLPQMLEYDVQTAKYAKVGMLMVNDGMIRFVIPNAALGGSGTEQAATQHLEAMAQIAYFYESRAAGQQAPQQQQGWQQARPY